MGDRANVVVFENASDSQDVPVWLYTHWRGSELPAILQDALRSGQERWSDTPYLCRIIFQAMLSGDTQLTGFGISTRMGDNGHPLLVLDCERQMVFEVDVGYDGIGNDALRSRIANSADGISFATYDGQWSEDRRGATR